MRKVVYVALLAAVLLPATTIQAESSGEKRAAEHIGSQLKQSGQLRNYRIGVQYQDGVAYLKGTVTSAEQRDTAIRLASQVDGVTRVVSKLKLTGESTKSTGNDRQSLAEALDRASSAAAQNDSSGVQHAYGETGIAPLYSPRRSSHSSSRAMANGAGSPRGNMPLPAQFGMGMPPVRQASAQAAYPAAGPCPGGCYGAPGAAMGPGGDGMMMGSGMGVEAMPSGFVPHGAGRGPSYENAQMPGYAWPSYASYPNYAALTYPRQYSPTAWPYIGPFYPYPQVPLAWRKVSLEWDDGWWFLDFSAHNSSH